MTEEGKLNGINLTYYGDCGMNPNDNSFPVMQTWADNGNCYTNCQSESNSMY